MERAREKDRIKKEIIERREKTERRGKSLESV